MRRFSTGVGRGDLIGSRLEPAVVGQGQSRELFEQVTDESVSLIIGKRRLQEHGAQASTPEQKSE